MRRLAILACTLFLAACVPVMGQGNPQVVLAWKVDQQEPSANNNQPVYALTLTLSGAIRSHLPLGTFVGSFADGRELSRQNNGALLTGVSWWAGAGDEFRVEQTQFGTIAILHRSIDVETDPGTYTVIKSLPLPQQASILVAPR